MDCGGCGQTSGGNRAHCHGPAEPVTSKHTVVGRATHSVTAKGAWRSLWVGPLQNLHHFWRSLGGWTFAFKDYYEMNLTSEFDSEAFNALHQVVDPYGEPRHCSSLDTAVRTAITAASHHHSPTPNPLVPHLSLTAAVYRDRLTMPKLIICIHL